MGTQLAEQINEVMPMGEVLELVQAAFEADIDQNNLMCDEIERLTSENCFLKLQVKNLTGRVENITNEKEELANTIATDNALAKNVAKGQFEIIENAKKCLQQEKQAKLELEQAKITIADLTRDKKKLKDDNAEFKKIDSTAAKIRAKLANEKAKTKKAQGFETQHKVSLGKADTEIFKLKKANLALNHKIAVSDLIEIHACGEYLLCLFPHQLGDIEGYKNNQVPLLCLHKGGRGGVMLLNNNDEAEIPPAPKGGFRPPKAIIEHAGNFLRRVESQGWTMSDKDIQSLNMKHLAA